MPHSMKTTGALLLTVLLAQQARPAAAGNVPSVRKVATAAVIAGLGATALALGAAPEGSGQATLATSSARLAFAEARTAYSDCWATDGPWPSLEQAPAHCRPGGPLNKAAEGAEAISIAKAMADSGYTEEYLGGADAAVRDLGDCVCQVLKRHGAAGAPGLAASLKATREQRKALGATIAEFYNVRKQIWNALKAKPALWNVPEFGDSETPVDDHLPLPLRAELLTWKLEAILLPAQREYDDKVEPLLDQLGEGRKAKTGRKGSGRSSRTRN